jgi:hypothetical protein
MKSQTRIFELIRQLHGGGDPPSGLVPSLVLDWALVSRGLSG